MHGCGGGDFPCLEYKFVILRGGAIVVYVSDKNSGKIYLADIDFQTLNSNASLEYPLSSLRFTIDINRTMPLHDEVHMLFLKIKLIFCVHSFMT